MVYRAIGSLQAVVQELVHLGDAGGDGEIDGTVTDLDDESTDNVGVDLNTCKNVPLAKQRESMERTSLVTLSFLPAPT